MKQFAAIPLALVLMASPALSQDSDEDGMSLMERGAQLFFEGITKEMGPALNELEGLSEQMRPALRDFAREMGPKLTDLIERVEDWSLYEAPEMLPNGDIIIRRKPDEPQDSPALPEGPAPQIDL